MAFIIPTQSYHMHSWTPVYECEPQLVLRPYTYIDPLAEQRAIARELYLEAEEAFRRRELARRREAARQREIARQKALARQREIARQREVARQRRAMEHFINTLSYVFEHEEEPAPTKPQPESIMVEFGPFQLRLAPVENDDELVIEPLVPPKDAETKDEKPTEGKAPAETAGALEEAPKASAEPAKKLEAHAEPAKKPEAHTEPAMKPEAAPEPAKAPEASAEPAKKPEAAPEPAKKPEASTEPAKAPEAAPEPAKKPDAEAPAATCPNTPASAPVLLMFHEFPKGAYGDYVRKHADASAINVEASPLNGGSISVSGLWPLVAPSSFGRAASPRSPRVRDADEDGNEVLLPEDSEPDSDAESTVDFSESVVTELPQAPFSGVRAELADDGFRLWIDV